MAAAREAGLIVIADGKRGDVPVSASAYGQALFGSTPTPWGDVQGLGVDAATVNPLLGVDALEPLIAAADAARGGVFCLVRTSNAGAADVLDLEAPDRPLFERLAELVAALGDRLSRTRGSRASAPSWAPPSLATLRRLRELMPRAIFLIPGIGAQGGSGGGPGPRARRRPASILVTASRSIADAPDPAVAAGELRAALWALDG